MLTPFDQLRADAAKRRDEKIRAARAEYRATCESIASIERSLGTVRKTRTARTIVGHLAEVISNGEPFTVAWLKAELARRFPERRFQYHTLYKRVRNLADRGLVDRVGIDDQGRGVYELRGAG